MGTTFNGKKPKNNVTIFTGNGDTAPALVDPETGRRTARNVPPSPAPAPEAPQAEAAQEVPERSFAQPSKVAPPTTPTPKVHASEQEADEAVRKHSTMRQDDGEGQDDAETSSD